MQSPDRVLGRAGSGNTVGGGTIAQGDGSSSSSSGLLILFTKSNLSCGAANSLTPSLPSRVNCIVYISIFRLKKKIKKENGGDGDENPSAKLLVLGSLNSTSFNSRFLFFPFSPEGKYTVQYSCSVTRRERKNKQQRLENVLWGKQLNKHFAGCSLRQLCVCVCVYDRS